MLIEFISESNNIYEFSIQLNAHTETISIYAPNYDTALKRANAYVKSLEPGVNDEQQFIMERIMQQSSLYKRR